MTITRMALVLFVVGTTASCDERPSYSDYEARSWDTTCAADGDCVLVGYPCDECGATRAVAAHERARHNQFAESVNCDDYTDDMCGDVAEPEPACVSGRCTASARR